MPIKSPEFWQKPDTFLSRLLSPFAKLYALGTKAHMKSVKPYRSKVPVICIGNLVMGGVGKTPLAISVAEFFKMNGKRPVFLTRGYGGGLSDILVDPDRHTAQDTGDEALLLARVAPTVVDYNRARGAKTAEITQRSVLCRFRRALRFRKRQSLSRGPFARTPGAGIEEGGCLHRRRTGQNGRSRMG